PDGATVLTHCWAETYLTETVTAVLRSGRRISAVCTETRPYLQGARLTAESLAEMGVPTRLITDGMPAHLMSRGEITALLTGGDRPGPVRAGRHGVLLRGGRPVRPATTRAELSDQLAEVGRIAVARGLVVASGGNLSARLPGDDEFLVTGAGTWLDRLEPGDFSVLTL